MGEDVKIIVVDSRHLHQWAWTGINFPCELLLLSSFHSHFKWDAVEHPIMDVGALEDPTLMLDSVPWVPTPFLPTKPGRSWMVHFGVATSFTPLSVELLLHQVGVIVSFNGWC